MEVELVWGLHASLFYLGARRWIFGLPVPEDVDALVTAKVEAFLAGAPATIAARIGVAAERRAAPD
jgi:hypothetical protein